MIGAKLVNFKKLSIAIIVLMLISLFCGVFLVKTANLSKKYTVVIDAGHGGIDGGASGITTGVKESEINLLIAKNIEEKFANLGFITIMTRKDGDGLYGTTEPGFKNRDLQKRRDIINASGADLCVSIHLNHYSSKSRRGAQAFFKKGNNKSEKLSKLIQSQLNGMRLSPRILSALSGDYYLLNESKVPLSIVECGFLSSPEDEVLLLTENYRNDLADAIVFGCLQFLSV